MHISDKYYLIHFRIDLKSHMKISYVQEHEDEFEEMITKKDQSRCGTEPA